MYGSDKLGTDIAVLGSIAVSSYMMPMLLARRMRSNLTTLLPAREIDKVRHMFSLRESHRTWYCQS